MPPGTYGTQPLLDADGRSNCSGNAAGAVIWRTLRFLPERGRRPRTMHPHLRNLALLLTMLFAVSLAVTQEKVIDRRPPRPVEPAEGARSGTPQADAHPAPPITFADPDGQELILEELSARTAIHGMLSLTELELRFRNPQARRIEGRFTCTLPPNAAISRFAKEVNGVLMEGEVVERLRANQVYEQFLHQMRDPALLEQDQGNRFSARIFPIEANAPVRLILSYTQLLPLRAGVRTYTLPLRGLSKVNRLTFRGFVTPVPGDRATGTLTRSTAEVTSFEESDWTPDRDITLTWNAPEDGRPRVLRAGDFYLAALRPHVAAASAAAPSSWRFFVDTSASAAEGSDHRIRALESLLGALPPSDRVQVLAFDNEVVPLTEGAAGDLARSIGDRLRARLFLGGTDVVAMLREVAHAKSGVATVVVSDLVATLGNTAAHDVQAAIRNLPDDARVHVVILGSREDGAIARALTARRGRILRVPFTESLAANAARAAGDLRRPLGQTVEIRDAAAEWNHPTFFNDVGSGDEVLVLGRTRAGEQPQLARDAVVVQLDPAFAPLLQREAYRAYLDHLAEREANESDDGVRRALANEQVRISIEQRIVVPRTTLLVLESEWDYQRFGIDRRALADILTIDAGGITRIDRRNGTSPMPRPVPVASVPPPPRAPQPMPFDGREDAAKTAAAEEDVAGGVVGGVVTTPVRQSAPASLAADAGLVAESITVAVEPAVEAPRPMTTVVQHDRNRAIPLPAPPPAAPVRAEREEKTRQATWTTVARPPRSRIAELEAQLRTNPRDRELYNQLSEVLAAHHEWSDLRALALRWQPYDPENPQVYEVLGLAADSLGNDTEAARAFASLIEVAPAKTELLQRAGLLLLRANRGTLAEAPLRRALEVRPDRANGYRHLAILLWREGRYEEAARVLESATRQTFPNWYRDVQRVIREELGYVYRAWIKHEPERRREIEDRAREYRADLDRRDALRVTLAWETDANDVDLHVVDPSGEECFYSHPSTKSGLQLYEDITQGLGPEVVRTARMEGGTYHIGVRYFAAGPMGISRGVVIVLTEDDEMRIHPFRLVQGGGQIRYVAAVKR